MTEKDNPKRSRRSSGAITLRDVAKLAGVAPITASRVLNTPDQVSEEVRQRVLDAVQRRTTVIKRFDVIGKTTAHLSGQAAIQALATSRLLQSGDLTEFYRQASEVRDFIKVDVVRRGLQ